VSGSGGEKSGTGGQSTPRRLPSSVHSAVPGRLACSVQGRDRGRFYLVVGTQGDNFVLVADGVVRKVERPKKKNVKHLVFYDLVAESIAGRLSAGRRVTNEELQSELENLVLAFEVSTTEKEVGLKT